ncbi:MAG TPA: hypothetical protein PKE37_09450 [Thiomonas arsenitoxydans]|uniref:hypothetical protein n=1 Tax=Thiomonas TaxID=32012 RepID=UPI00257AC205|nr:MULTISPECIES: hypothetical protein [Thiomonas]HML81976.1 hypothetical protein [Thiomonas arsenitoxydans]
MNNLDINLDLREPDIIALMHAADAVDAGHWLMRCPAHRGASASSLEVTLAAGRYTLRCNCGCSPAAIIAAALALAQARVAGLAA